MALDTEPPVSTTLDSPPQAKTVKGLGFVRRVLPSDRYGLAIFAAVVLASVALVPLTADSTFLWLGTAVTGVICLIGVITRRLDVDPLIILLAQLVVLAAFLLAMAATAGNPDLGVFARMPDLYAAGINDMASQPTPMQSSAGVTLLFVTAIGVIAIMTDHLVQTVQRPVWALAPILTLYLITALVPNLTAPWWAFVSMAVGYLLILIADGMNRADGWTRGIAPESDVNTKVGSLAWQLAAVIGIPAIVLAILVAMVIPVRDAGGNWSFTPPAGGGGPLQLSNPAQDLKRNLTQPEDRVVMIYQTNATKPEYLRMATLPRFDNQGFSGVPIQLQNGTDLGPPPGVSNPGDPSVQTSIQIGELNSQYLPLPYPTDRFEAPGTWAYDPSSLMVLASGQNRDTATANLQYTVTSYPSTPDGAGLSTAEVGRPDDYQFSGQIPDDLPPELIDLTMRVTADAATPALKAAAIQEYLRSDEFTYSLEPSDSSGYEALEEFLLRDKRGFCVQFAGSMAMMARIVGIPTRMAVGFLPGTKVGDNYEVTIRNMHAWPELYFEEYGWVRFEPTQSVASPPPWTITGGEQQDDQRSSAEPSVVPMPTDEPTTSAEPIPTPEEDDRSVRDEDLLALFGRVALAIGVVALLAALAAIPALMRSHRRKQRLSWEGPPSARVENAWSEVRDLVVDHGHDWPTTSPRETGELVARWLDEKPGRAMRRLSVLVERARYARDYQTKDDPIPLVRRVEEGLQAREDGRIGRITAKLWPRSVWYRGGTPLRGPRR